VNAKSQVIQVSRSCKPSALVGRNRLIVQDRISGSAASSRDVNADIPFLSLFPNFNNILLGLLGDELNSICCQHRYERMRRNVISIGNKKYCVESREIGPSQHCWMH